MERDAQLRPNHPKVIVSPQRTGIAEPLQCQNQIPQCRTICDSFHPDLYVNTLLCIVVCQLDNYGFRAIQMRQCKTQSAGNGEPFPRTATPQWRIWLAPVEQGDKRSSALLHSLALATASAALVRLASERFSSCCIRNYQVDRLLGRDFINIRLFPIHSDSSG